MMVPLTTLVYVLFRYWCNIFNLASSYLLAVRGIMTSPENSQSVGAFHNISVHTLFS